MRVLRILHRWLGLALALPLLVQGLTGTVLTLEPWLASMGRHPVAETGSANEALAAALAVGPPGMRAARYVPPGGAGEPARVYLLQADRARGPSLLVEVDPVTATALGPARPVGGVMEWIKRLHENWLAPELGGRQFAGWLGVGLVVLVMLGVPLWWPRKGEWADGFTVPKRARGARLQRRLHGAMGAWCGVLLLATGVTGIVQGFPQTTRAALGVQPAGPPRAPAAGDRGVRAGRPEGRPEGQVGPARDLDAALRLARQAAPGLVLRVAFLPPGTEPTRLALGPPGVEGATTATTVVIDAAGSRVISVQAPSGFSAGEATVRWARDLHVGEGMGPVWKALTAVTGVVLPAFGVTGFLLWLIKRRNRAQARRGAELAGQPAA